MKFIFAAIAFVQLFELNAQTINAGEYFISFDSTRIYYEVVGSGKAVLLVHGFTGSTESWKKALLYEDLIKDGYQVITLDLRGNGKSDKPQDLKAYQDDAEARDIMQLITHLRLKKYFAVGYSRGSIIVSRLAVKDKRLQRLVMGGMGDGFMDPNWPRRVLFYKALSNQEDVEELRPMIKSVRERGLDQLALANQQGAQPSTSAAELATRCSALYKRCRISNTEEACACHLR
jgi:pimeloyl-ACP methyl ester carboxylesterase